MEMAGLFHKWKAVGVGWNTKAHAFPKAELKIF